MLSVLRIKIVDYYESLIDKVDLKAQALIIKEFSSVPLINERKKSFTQELKNLEAICLRNFYLTNLMNYRDVPDDVIDDMIFKTFCFIIDSKDLSFNELNNVDATFGYLVVVDKHLSREKITRYRELLKFSTKRYLNQINSFFNFNNRVIFLKNILFCFVRLTFYCLLKIDKRGVNNGHKE